MSSKRKKRDQHGQHGQRGQVTPRDFAQALAQSADDEVVYYDETTGEGICTRAELKVAQEEASEDDRVWFEQHPLAKGRVRAFIPNEIPVSSQKCEHVFVRQVKPGIRMRQPLVVGWQPFTYFRIDPETGEVLGKYSDAEAWQDQAFSQLKETVDRTGL